MITYTYIVAYFMHRIQHFASYIYNGLVLLKFPANAFFLEMNMTRKFHNHRLQTDPRLHEEGTHHIKQLALFLSKMTAEL